MMQKNRILYILFLIVFLSACDFFFPSKHFIGKWQCVSWTIEGKPGNYNTKETHFDFKENDLYEANISGTKEKGAFYVEGDKLMTTAENAMQIITLVEKINADSLVLSMNRGGTTEQMILIKQH